MTSSGEKAIRMSIQKNAKNRRGAMRRNGFVSAEIGLFILLLAMLAGAMSFAFFLSSRDMKSAQSSSVWARNVERLLDLISIELQNTSHIEFPFHGEGNQCLYRRPLADWSLQASSEVENFLISDGTLSHFVRDASGTNQVHPFSGIPNPLVSGIQSGHFERVGPRLLRLYMKIAPPDAPGSPVTFERSIHLRNQ